MKKLGFIGAMALLCTTAMAQTPYNIKGTWAGGEGQKVYIYERVERQINNLDSAVVAADGTFCMKGQFDAMRQVTFGYDGRGDNIFIADQPEINITVQKEMVKDKKGDPSEQLVAKIDGGEEQTVFNEINGIYTSKIISRLGMMLAISQHRDDSLAVDSLAKGFTAVMEEIENGLREKIKQNNHVAAVPFLICEAMLSDYSLDELKEIYDGLTPHVKETQAGVRFKQTIERLSTVTVGGVAPDFTLPTPDGGTISLSQLRGKVVLLDFWATWCGPCLREMPNVKNIYEQYHAKGLEILGVSLDEEKDKEKWQKMIVDRGFSWNHGSSLKGWDCPVARMFNVTAIPRMYILDREGRIIAQDLRGEALANKIAEIFDK